MPYSTSCNDQPPTPARSLLMGRVRHRGTAPELLLRQALWTAGLRYRLGSKPHLPGSPDLVFPGAKIAVFVDGCFWHGCPLHGSHPKTREAFWAAKITRNQVRDLEVDAALATMGWSVVRLWEHEIKTNLVECVERIRSEREKRFKLSVVRRAGQ
ncbi:MAG: very short patch repair endonuclease [Pseudomonadota bacterium]|nr:very short patch repair endonuclease [Pseudomonadota bacterium]